jgi:hypothetical protein
LAKVLGDGGKGGLAGFDHLAGSQISIHYRNPEALKMIGHGGFSAANAAR